MSQILWGPPRTGKLNEAFVVFHGGLGPGDTRGHRSGKPSWLVRELREVAHEIQKGLRKNQSAADLCLRGAEQLEQREIFNAGRGAKLQADGVARLSASAMDGTAQRIGAVFNVRNLETPSKLAYKLLSQNDRCLAGVEANEYAFANGFKPQQVETEYRIQQWKTAKEGLTGTVGCIALDTRKNTFAITSTGGRGMETPGRVSDSGTPAGNFATRFGAVSCTGVGEDILDVSLASAVVTRLEDGMTLQEAVSRSFFRHRTRRFGMIGLDNNGFVIAHATQGTLSFGVVTKNWIYVGLQPDDWKDFLQKNF